MGLRFTAARAASSVFTWGLQHVFHRPAAMFPGKVALRVDPQAITDSLYKLSKGSIMVAGTNGKTTVNNMLADVFEGAGERIICNRSGANMSPGIATALLHGKPADWGVFECDELWLARVMPQVKPKLLVLLNLFRDQLDRMGEIRRIQDSIVGALNSSPDTALLYNADDPLCAIIADRVQNRSMGFGIDEDLHLPQNTVVDAQMCQKCDGMFEYKYRQYGQLGDYHCPTCGFSRPPLTYATRNVHLGADGMSFAVEGPLKNAATENGAESPSANDAASDAPNPHRYEIHASFSGAYMAYNLTAVTAAADILGLPHEVVQRIVDTYNPQNGRLQTFDLDGRKTLLNLAKNPTGFNQNLKIVAQDPARKAVAFFINDKEADGHDVSWLWDIDFEELRASGEMVVYSGGIRGRDMQVRLKYAGVASEVVADANDCIARIDALPQDVNAYLIANYTALPEVHAALDRRVKEGKAADAVDAADGVDAVDTTNATNTTDAADATNTTDAKVVADTPPAAEAPATSTPAVATPAAPDSSICAENDPLVIVHLFPDLLNLYGDGGNVRVLEYRLRWRNIPVEVRRISYGEAMDWSNADLVFMGGGPDREQRLATGEIMHMRDDLEAYVNNDGVLLAICGGYQILGHEWLLGDEVVEGLGLIDFTTERPGTSADRLIANVILRSPYVDMPVVGYENHAGRTRLGPGVKPFGTVISSEGHGNNEDDKTDGVLYKNLLGTYLHGPLLAKNPQVADTLLKKAFEQRARRRGETAVHIELPPLDDSIEIGANEALCKRFGAK